MYKPIETITSLWVLLYIFYEGDCLIEMNKLQDNSIDMILCDLPYGMTSCKWDCVIPFDKLWESYKRICKKNAAICLFGSEPFSSYLRISNIKWFKYDWIWHKNSSGGFATNEFFKYLDEHGVALS